MANNQHIHADRYKLSVSSDNTFQYIRGGDGKYHPITLYKDKMFWKIAGCIGIPSYVLSIVSLFFNLDGLKSVSIFVVGILWVYVRFKFWQQKVRKEKLANDLAEYELERRKAEDKQREQTKQIS